MHIVSTIPFLFLFLQIRADFAKKILNEHNKYRQIHGCPKLVLDYGLNLDCKNYAEEIADANELKHSDGPYGENLCYTTSNPVNCVKDWYNEIEVYNYNKPVYSPATGHFTQLIWKSSNTLGVGKHSNADGKTFVVARYKPAGNVPGGFEKNVPRPSRSDEKNDCSKYLIILSWIFLMVFSQAC